MDHTSTIALALLLGLLTGVASAVVLLPLWQRARWSTTRAELTRLRLAEHWARGGLLSSAQEPWRPCCTGIAIAALGASDLEQVDAILTARAAGATDPQVQNVWKQARAELQATRDAPDAIVANSSEWPRDALKMRIAALLEDVERGALQIVDARGAARCSFAESQLGQK
jgi:hypothetical protein